MATLQVSHKRRQIEQATGLRILENGHIAASAYVIGCPHFGCRFAASARSDGRATRALAAHIVKMHLQDGKE